MVYRRIQSRAIITYHLTTTQDVVISVADTGPGITLEDRERVFMPFEQLEPSARRKHGGTGLGLAISKSFVELHGGQMWLESEKGRGSTFFVRIPTGAAAASQGGAVSWLSPDWEYRQRARRPGLPPPLIRRRLVVVDKGGHWSRRRCEPNRPVRSEAKGPRKKRAAEHNTSRKRAEPTRIERHALERCPDCDYARSRSLSYLGAGHDKLPDRLPGESRRGAQPTDGARCTFPDTR
jgi:hypothetical protein